MKNVIRTSWRDAATLIVLSRKHPIAASRGVNYDILFQTRTARASFANSVVFPGGVSEAADASESWLQLFKTFGFEQRHFHAFHCEGAPTTPIFQDNPVRRHVALRISAIRETFEEVGLLLCSRQHQSDRSGPWASILPDVDLKHWQHQVSKDPGALLSLCQEYKCYPDIWALHYWSNWLTPTYLPTRFDAAFFVAALENEPERLQYNSEVATVQWANPLEILEKCNKREVILFPPQAYELNRLLLLPDCEELIRFASNHSAEGSPLLYAVTVKTKDGELHLLPGDDLYPSEVDYHGPPTQNEKTVLELREGCATLHRYECQGSMKQFITRNYKSNHIDMGDRVITVHA